MSLPSTVLTVSALTHLVKNLLESTFPSVEVQGEISNFKPNSSGHLYFDLKDAQAKIAVVMFKGAASSLTRMPKEGDKVTLKGSFAVYPPHGKYQLIAEKISFQGVGELLLKLEELKKRLQERGWFDKERKKPIPKFPTRIGIVTSPTGAVIRDIIHVLSRRLGNFHLILNPVRVQGEEAASEIAEAIRLFNLHGLADVLIVGRGGGSLEDLWSFNDEKVAQAIFTSTIPIISAVGHETDFTIADFVADMRAPTPSAAAEIVSAEKVACLEFLRKTARSCRYTIATEVKHHQERLRRFSSHPLLTSPFTLLAQRTQRLDEMQEALERVSQHQLREKKLLLDGKKRLLASLRPVAQLRLLSEKLKNYDAALNTASVSILRAYRTHLLQMQQKLQGVNPKNVLKRGYAILFARKTGSVIVSKEELTVGKQLRVQLADGEGNVVVDHSS